MEMGIVAINIINIMQMITIMKSFDDNVDNKKVWQ